MKGAADAIVVVVSVAATFVVAATTQPGSDSFTATATVKHGSTSASTAVEVKIDRYASEAERAALIKAVREGGGAAARDALRAHDDAGYIQLGDRRTPIKYAWRAPTTGGRLITIATAQPILFLGAGMPQAGPTSGFDVAVAILEVRNGESGVGELAPAAQVTIDDSGALRLQDYSALVIWLNHLRAK